MPIGIQRLNARQSHPNDRIIFIKPLKGPYEKVAQDFLERLAAQCLPVMRNNHLSVMSLEEHEPNREFAGRNFNAGECIQLVLRSRANPNQWLPFKMVQMVMMHELAHCKQMNHSRAFWAVRNQYAEEMQALWRRNYTGDGMWGRGFETGTGLFVSNVSSGAPDVDMPVEVCGGMYRSRNNKRKRDWKADRDRRVLKKFGANGTSLGGDELVRQVLEKGRTTAATPRQAGSKRGRELRAAAALARFSTPATPSEDKKPDEQSVEMEDDDTDGDFLDDADDDALPTALDMHGKQLVDRNGQGLIKVCGDEAPDQEETMREMEELAAFQRPNRLPTIPRPPEPTQAVGPPGFKLSRSLSDKARLPPAPKPDTRSKSKQSDGSSVYGLPPPLHRTCDMCRFENEGNAIICDSCTHVLQPRKVPGAWKCKDKQCPMPGHLNADVCLHCAICGVAKPT